MADTIIQRKHSILVFLLSIALVMAGCSEPSKPDNGEGGTTANTLAAPTITTHPASQNIVEGNTATLSVAANGATLSYQWQKAANGSTTFTNVARATSANYVTLTLTTADSGVQYRVVVTAINAAKLTNSTTSNIAILTVLSTPPATPVTTTHMHRKQPRKEILLD